MTPLRTLFLFSTLFLAACSSQQPLTIQGYSYYGNHTGNQAGVIQDIQYDVHIDPAGTHPSVANTPVVLGPSATKTSTMPGSNKANLSLSVKADDDKNTSILYIVKLNQTGTVISVAQTEPLALCIGDYVYLRYDGTEPHLSLNTDYYAENKHVRSGCVQQEERE